MNILAVSTGVPGGELINQRRRLAITSSLPVTENWTRVAQMAHFVAYSCHTPTKASLVVEVLKRYREQLVRTTERLDHELPNPLDRLKWIVQRWETCIQDQSESFCVATLLTAELPVLPQEVRAEVRHYFDHLGEWLESTFAQGRRAGRIFFHGTPRVEAQNFIALVHGAMLSARAYGACGVYRDITQSTLKRLSIRK